MKRIYWRPKQVSHRALLLIAGISTICLIAVERFKTNQSQPFGDEKLKASELALQGFGIVREARLRSSPEYSIDPLLDPTRSGLIGYSATAVTSTRGTYLSKRTSINPNFAGVIVDMLKNAGVERGDYVAVATSGSFPAINLCAYAALHTLGAKPVIIASAAASEFGANDPNFLWLDMESALRTSGIIPFKAAVATYGGMDDMAKGLPESSLVLLDKGIERNGIEFMAPESLEDSVKKRFEVYKKAISSGKKYKAYINIGGGMASTGGHDSKEAYKPGLNMRGPSDIDPKFSIMGSFSEKKIPVIHLIEIKELAQRYQLDQAPTVMPEPGAGGVFKRVAYNRYFAAAGLILIVGVLTVFVRTHWGAQFLRPHAAAQKSAGDVEPMI